MIPLVVGTALALATLSFVLYPLFVSRDTRVARPAPSTDDVGGNPAIDALREIEFDRETGKLSDGDYAALRSEYMQRAVTEMRAGDAHFCPRCGPRPELDAMYCSSCGSYLAARNFS